LGGLCAVGWGLLLLASTFLVPSHAWPRVTSDTAHTLSEYETSALYGGQPDWACGILSACSQVLGPCISFEEPACGEEDQTSTTGSNEFGCNVMNINYTCSTVPPTVVCLNLVQCQYNYNTGICVSGSFSQPYAYAQTDCNSPHN
jgi:hypothetical protein